MGYSRDATPCQWERVMVVVWAGNLKRISIAYSGDAYSLLIRKSGGFIGGLGGQITLALKH